ncbi:hypothetical protein AX14_009003 [Amanita brunnescens Koide BX004]|nr:hypothetical protein AX14_009003 [Amanita brunnescens Koide BX004]
MSLKTMEPDWRLELESTYPERLVQCRKIYENMARESLIRSRQVTRHFAFDNRTKRFHNRILIPKDCRSEDTEHHLLRAGIICSVIGWNLQEKIDENVNQSTLPTHQKHR